MSENDKVVTFEDSVKERLKSIVAELIPEDRWDSIVKATVADFEKNDLPKIIKAELAEKYEKMIVSELSKPEWQNNWSSNGQQFVSDKIKELIIESAPLILAGMVGNAMQDTLAHLRNQISYNKLTY